MRRIFAVIAALALALATLAGVARLTAPTTDAAALAAPCEIRVWVNNVPTGPRFAISAAQYPEFCGAPPTATPLPPTATAVPPTNTPAPPTPTPTPGVTSIWHTPTDHEHGDAPPSFVVNWIAANAAVYGSSTLVFGGDENTGPLENGMKHNVYKGFILTSPAGTQIYMRYHAGANPMDRSAQFHSYEVWFLDTAGGVSFLQGWYDAGDPAPHPQGARFPRRLGESSERPVILVVDQATLNDGVGNDCEQWYMFGQGAHRPDFAVTICGVPYLYNANENATAHDVNTWQRNPDGSVGVHRRAETFWFPDRGVSGVTYTTPLGVPCTAGSAGCLYNYVAPTLANDTRDEFGVQRISSVGEKTFPGEPGVGGIN